MWVKELHSNVCERACSFTQIQSGGPDKDESNTFQRKNTPVVGVKSQREVIVGVKLSQFLREFFRILCWTQASSTASSMTLFTS